MTYSAKDLLLDWISAEVRLAGETSINYVKTYQGIIDKAKSYACDLGIGWEDKFIPEHVTDLLQADKELQAE